MALPISLNPETRGELQVSTLVSSPTSNVITSYNVVSENVPVHIQRHAWFQTLVSHLDNHTGFVTHILASHLAHFCLVLQALDRVSFQNINIPSLPILELESKHLILVQKAFHHLPPALPLACMTLFLNPVIQL